MKKYMFITILIIVVICIALPQNDAKNTDIRIRVIANSNSSSDQNIKYEIVNILKRHIKSKEDIKKTEAAKLEISEYFLANKINYSYDISYCINNFPPKELNGKLIPGGSYQTLLVTLGEGKGDNYWSLLYPSYFDISFEDVQSGNVEVKVYFFDKIKSIFSK